MYVGIITCTKGRHSRLEEQLWCMLNQDYKGRIFILIYNNSRVKQRLGDFPIPDNVEIKLVNNYINPQTEESFTKLGQIFRDTLNHIPEDIELLNFADDDDLYLPNHISQAVERIGDRVAWKPYYSYFRTPTSITLQNNVHEPANFVLKSHVLQHGFYEGADFHHKWIQAVPHPLDDPGATPTFIYQWIGLHQFSGNDSNPLNFTLHEQTSTDEGDGVINPTHVSYPDLPL